MPRGTFTDAASPPLSSTPAAVSIEHEPGIVI
jgi:hypothetical protein